MDSNQDKNLNSNCTQVIMTGFSCNNNCVVCSVKPFALTHPDNKTEEVIKLMKAGRDSGIDTLEFTGGEPTIRKDIIFLINEAKKLGYREIALSTNARAFCNNVFLEAAVSGGLTRVTATMDGPNSLIHDAITRTPGSFDQTEKGIRALLSRDIEVSVNTVLCKLNFPHIQKIAERLIDLKIPVWGILDLIPDGNIAKAYPSFCLSLEDMREALNTAYNYIDKFRLIELFDFSVCVVPKEMRADNRIIIFDAFTRSNILKQTGYDPKRFNENNGIYNDEHKTRLFGCLECLKKDGCAGVWTNHIGAIGEDEDNDFVFRNKISA